MLRLLVLLACLGALAPLSRAADAAAPDAIWTKAEPALLGPRSPTRLEAMAAVHRATLEIGAAGDTPASRRWFGRLRDRVGAVSDAEVAYFIQTQLRLDPAGASFNPLDAKPVTPAPYQPGQGVAAQLADAARSIELGEAPRLTAAQLRGFAGDPKLDEALSSRALILLRRLDPAAASPLLWQRLWAAKRRSDVLLWEEQILRLPVASVGQVAYDAKASPATRAAWLRLAAVRPTLPVSQPDRNGWIALLKGPANEVTEAAWDAAPRVFRAADRAELEALTKDASERLAPRMKAALQRLR